MSILGVSTSLARTGAIFYISGFVALSHPRANEERESEVKKKKTCNERTGDGGGVAATLRQDLDPLT